MKDRLFCDACGKIWKFEKENDKIIAKCECGFSKEFQDFPVYSEKIKEKEYVGEGVIKEHNEINEGIDHTCPKCSHNKCEAALVAAHYSDESDLIFYRCKKCSYVERQADGSSNG
ncbi:MAG: hypothetical protein WCK29_00325 [archaeon]